MSAPDSPRLADQVATAPPVTAEDAAALVAQSAGRTKPKRPRKAAKAAEAAGEGDLSAAERDADIAAIKRAFRKGGLRLALSVGRALPGFDDAAIEALFKLKPLALDKALKEPKPRETSGRKRPPSGSPDGEGDEAAGAGGAPPGPRDLGFALERMNRDFALLLMGSKAVILHEQPQGPIEDRVRILTIDAFRAWFLNRTTEIVDKDGKLKAVTWATRFLADRGRRQYRGIEFLPNPDGAAPTPGYFNLWRGFAQEPDRSAGSYAIFRDHLLTNLCEGDRDLYAWVFAWFAHIVQRPRERLGTALVIRGGQGSGKTKIGQVFGQLLPSHYFLVDDPRYLVGNFNAHMASCLLLQADEGFWAGDKAAEGRLKGLITADTQMIEAKGVDPIRLKNFVRVLITSNHDWVIPAGKDERRFCVLDISDRCAQNHGYFAEMDAELDAGGRAALLADLLAFDLASVNLRQIPRTEALLEQKLRSLHDVESWWLERLSEGAPTSKNTRWQREVPKDGMFDDYIAMADKIGVKRKAEKTAFGIKLKKLVPGISECRPTMDVGPGTVERVRCYRLPALEDCRAAFEKAVNQAIAWEDFDAGERPGFEG